MYIYIVYSMHIIYTVHIVIIIAIITISYEELCGFFIPTIMYITYMYIYTSIHLKIYIFKRRRKREREREKEQFPPQSSIQQGIGDFLPQPNRLPFICFIEHGTNAQKLGNL